MVSINYEDNIPSECKCLLPLMELTAWTPTNAVRCLSSSTAHALPLSTTAEVLPFSTGAFSISAVVRVVSKNASCSRSTVVRVVSTRAEHIGPSTRPD
ncbi:hypothetical protein Tco_0936550 [Tanacetum coccineum]